MNDEKASKKAHALSRSDIEIAVLYHSSVRPTVLRLCIFAN